MALVPAMIDHLLAPFACTRKQFSLEPFQVVQKPSCESFHVPSALAPLLLSGSRVILPSGLKTILNFTFESVDAVNAWPVKNVASISFGNSRPAGAARTAPAPSTRAVPAIAARIDYLRMSDVRL